MIGGDERLNEEDNSWRRWKVEQSKNFKKHKIIKDAKDAVQKDFCKHSLHASKKKKKKAICYIRSLKMGTDL